MNSTIFRMIIIGFFLSLGSFAFGQFSIPVPEKLVYDELNKSQITLIDYKLGLMSYIKPEHSYHPTLGAFCVLENKIAQKTNFPVKMRLGSVDYVDKLEKKRN